VTFHVGLTREQAGGRMGPAQLSRRPRPAPIAVPTPTVGKSQEGRNIVPVGENVFGPPVVSFIAPTIISAQPKPKRKRKQRKAKRAPAILGITPTTVEAKPKFIFNAPVVPGTPVMPVPIGGSMPTVIEGRPGDERGFIHKKILGGISKLAGILPIPGANIISGITGILAGSGTRIQTASTTIPTTFLPRPTPTTIPGIVGPIGAAPCRFPLVTAPNGQCVSPESPLGQDIAAGIPVAGLYGAGFVPRSEIRDVAVCPTGFALGTDGVCYDHLRNRQRMYPRGRRPLLTGGDLNAITRARSAATKLKNARSDLTALGMLKAPTRRRRRK